MIESPSLQAFNRIYTDYRSRFVRFANSYVKDISVAEDITTEAFIAYWENRNTIASDSNIPAYILTIIKNKCLNYLSRSELKSRILTNLQGNAEWELNLRISTLEACNPEELFSTEIKRIVDDTLASLPEKTLKVFRLSRYKNKSHKEIAKILNITTKGVEFHITKALARLRTNLKDYIFFILFIL